MTDGRNHDIHGVVLALFAFFVTPFLIFHTKGFDPLGLPIGVLLGTFLLSPDLDITHSLPSRRWGPLRYLWWPYSAFHSHRGLSHHPLVGPLGRLAYLAALVLPVLYLLGKDPLQVQYLRPTLYLAGGVVLANWVHLLGDS